MQSEGSATRLILIPWLLSLVLPFIVVVEEGGKVIGLVVLTKYLFSGCACTSHLDWVAQHTAFQDLGNIFRVVLVDEFHNHISNCGAYSNRQPFLIICGRQD